MEQCKNLLHAIDNPSLSPVLELQRNLTSRELRNAGILPTTPPMCESPGSPSSKEKAAQLKLKEPRDLYSTATLLHPIKWPVECQVIPEKIRHVDSVPSKLEPFYGCTGKEPQPQPVGVEMGTVVYDYQPKLSVDYFCRATIGGSQELQAFDSSEPASLRFESRFESGNLARAIKVTSLYYELYLRPDLYTERHAQWFYFRIQNTKENVSYRFSIVNFNKPDSLYRYGLKVLMYSEKEAQLNNIGWTRCGQNIAYFKNDISQDQDNSRPDDNGPYYTLTFNVKFRHNNDTVYLAQCYPYTYSTLQNYLKSIEDDEFKSQLLTIRLLCRSLAGNNVYILTVTSPDNHQEENSKKPVIVISARVHPCETQSSYMMKGIIDFLTSDCSQAQELRDRFIFKLIPMLNPDGVIVGNSRCCLLGQDLNRQYRTVLREAFPQIYHIKVMLRRLQEENGIFLYCDLHGHSRRHNVFIYGCENRRVPEKRLLEQVFPLMMHKNAADKFSFQNCKFKVQKNKEGTGRIFVWTLGVINSYTLEISLGGSTMPSRQFTHFNTGDYEACGRHFCETLLDYSDPNPMKENLRDRILQKLLDGGSTADEPKNVVLSDYSSLSHSETEEGDDDDSGDEADGEDGNIGTNALLRIPSNGAPSSPSAPPSSPNNNSHNQNSHKLKRQSSLRKHQNHHNRNKSAGRTPIVMRSLGNERSPLPVHRASVDFTKIKQRKLEDAIVISPLDSSPAVSGMEDSTGATSSGRDFNTGNSQKEKEFSAAYRRLTKFRRKSRRMSGATVISPDNLDNPSYHNNSSHQYLLTAKCTRILFDDPFNPPGTNSNRSQRKPMVLSGGGDSMDVDDDGPLQSGTEDECDPYDVTIKNKNFLGLGGSNKPTIKITDCSDTIQDEDPLGLAGDMSRLQISKVTASPGRVSVSKSDSESCPLPSFTPFVPSFPVGKAFLHQTFYPDSSTIAPPASNKKEPVSPNRTGVGQKMKTSLSDTTLTGGAVGVTVPSPLSQMKPVARRSSISYLVHSSNNPIASNVLSRGKLQATGSTIVGSSNSGPSMVASSRRRVSWTGTLTVSVPNVPITATVTAIRGIASNTATTMSSQRKKSFRKSKSLNDKQGSNTELMSDLQEIATPKPLQAAIDKTSSSSKGRSNQPVEVTMMPSSTGYLGTKKRRAKLKRTKHK